jgi:peptide/nickel transport system substrate-binding protein
VPNWDPNAGGPTIIASIYKSVFETPMTMTPDLAFAPSMVQSYQWLDETGTVLELKLRDGVTFHNGDRLTSADIRFTFLERPQAEQTLNMYGVWGRVVADVATPDAATAVFKFNTPFVAAPALMADVPCYIIPKAYFQSVGREGFMARPVGSGPYKLVDYQRDSRIVLEAHDKYWAGPPPIQRVTFQIVKDASARIAAVQAGQVDFAHNIPVREVTRLGAVAGLVGDLAPITNVMLIQMVNKGIYKDRNLRLAMHHAIDKTALSKAFFGGKATPLSMWSAPGMAAYDANFNFPFDPRLARDLLAKSGYGPDNPAKIVFNTFNGVFPNDYDVARAMTQMWKGVGIETDLQVMDILKYSDMSRSDKLEAPVLYSWSNATGDPEFYSGYILDPRKRSSVWKSDDVPPKLDPLLKEVDYAKRMAGYRAFDAWAVEQGYAVPLLQGTNTVVHQKRLNYAAYKSGWILPASWSLTS